MFFFSFDLKLLLVFFVVVIVTVYRLDTHTGRSINDIRSTIDRYKNYTPIFSGESFGYAMGEKVKNSIYYQRHGLVVVVVVFGE